MDRQPRPEIERTNRVSAPPRFESSEFLQEQAKAPRIASFLLSFPCLVIRRRGAWRSPCYGGTTTAKNEEDSGLPGCSPTHTPPSKLPFMRKAFSRLTSRSALTR